MIDLNEIPSVANAAVREAYPDCPSVGRLMLEAAAYHHLWRSAAERPDQHSADYQREHARMFWLLYGAALDIVALQSDLDIHSAAQAARAGAEVTRLEGGWTPDTTTARQRLRDTYQAFRDGQLHPWNCPGGCGGQGWSLQVVTEENQGDGIWVPVWQEPVECDRGLDLPHLPDCACRGSGWTVDLDEHGHAHERGRCSGVPAEKSAEPVDRGALPGWEEPPF